ncbi:MAG TPA: hypothetical protein VK750_05560, partial [Cytophagaceae bacterium]|nr:hypothetical protein [Cytophagaceae bacterium]
TMSFQKSIPFLFFLLLISLQGTAQNYTFKFIRADTRTPVTDLHVNVNWDMEGVADPILVYSDRKKLFTFSRRYFLEKPLKLSIVPPNYYFPGVSIGGAVTLDEKYTKIRDFQLEVLPTLKINLIKHTNDAVVVGVKIPHCTCDNIEKKLYLKRIKKNNDWNCFELSDTLSALSFTMVENNHTLYGLFKDYIYLDLFFTNEKTRSEKIKITPGTREINVIINPAESSSTGQ